VGVWQALAGISRSWVVTALLGNSRLDRKLLDAIEAPARSLAEIKDILAQGANPNAPDYRSRNLTGREGQTTLHYAAKWQGQAGEELVRMLLQSGANPRVASRYGHTPLHYFALHGALSGLAQLLDAGADINAFNKVGHAPLHYAAANAQAGATRLLLERGANVNGHAVASMDPDLRRKTPILLAVDETTNIDERLEVIDLLIRNGAWLTTAPGVDWAPLDAAKDWLESFGRHPDGYGNPRAGDGWERIIALLESRMASTADT